MKRTGFYGDQSVDYRRTEPEQPTAVMVLRVTYNLPLDSTAHTDFATVEEAAGRVLALMRLIRASRRGNVTVQAL